MCLLAFERRAGTCAAPQGSWAAGGLTNICDGDGVDPALPNHGGRRVCPAAACVYHCVEAGRRGLRGLLRGSGFMFRSMKDVLLRVRSTVLIPRSTACFS